MQENKTVFILMPFGTKSEYEGGNKESNCIYEEIIIKAIERSCIRDSTIIKEVDKNRPGSITGSIVTSLVEAEVVIADITGWNPNVFLELGIRYSLRNKVTILLAQEDTNIPFDIRNYRLIKYNKYEPEIARKRIADYINAGLSDNFISDSIVFDTFKDLSVSIPGKLESHGKESSSQKRIMSWEEYHGRIIEISRWLKPLVAEAKYLPNAVFGISNGGMIVADLIGKTVFSGMNHPPILGLWAERWKQDSLDYFNNAFNDAITDCLKEHHSPNQSLKILLIDDHYGSGSTSTQAIKYFEKRFDSVHVLFLPLISRRSDNLSKVSRYLPYNLKLNDEKLLKLDEQEYISSLNTQADFFPYLNKQISTGFEDITSLD